MIKNIQQVNKKGSSNSINYYAWMDVKIFAG